MKYPFSTDHIGWITNDITMFERFWCDILGYECTYKSTLEKERAAFLFGAGEAETRRYSRPGCLDIEIHKFTENEPSTTGFHRVGMNHVCLFTGGKGTRNRFLADLPAEVEKKIYRNEGGWDNIFIKDFEGNWIELRERL